MLGRRVRARCVAHARWRDTRREDGEEREYQFAARLGALEEVAHVQLAGRVDHVAEAFEHLGHRDLVALDLKQDLLLAAREYLLEDAQKVERPGRDLRVLLVGL